MAQVSQNYLEGIREARALRKLIDDSVVVRIAEAEIKFCDDAEYWAGSGLHKDFIQGQRDFWVNQLKLAGE